MCEAKRASASKTKKGPGFSPDPSDSLLLVIALVTEIQPSPAKARPDNPINAMLMAGHGCLGVTFRSTAASPATSVPGLRRQAAVERCSPAEPCMAAPDRFDAWAVKNAPTASGVTGKKPRPRPSPCSAARRFAAGRAYHPDHVRLARRRGPIWLRRCTDRRCCHHPCGTRRGPCRRPPLRLAKLVTPEYRTCYPRCYRNGFSWSHSKEKSTTFNNLPVSAQR